ncbi:hypothetical protein THC_1191 [Caldimicrobium thiodismutans]|uniref:Methyltransferase domain-containing protein n=1 Tax=Caldimicrobium thiodismutans TaxID=1653476 RepID=A0A0U4W398_9BACT|nr:class I SAM-dependent methyltransferase [Caldimicrobium thiodismutans]BAU23562.1 hypothetical protein THC_1191 [Caldimicrobium thiodismutans]
MIMKITQKMRKKYKLLGLKGIILCVLYTGGLIILNKFLKFDRWHIKGNYYCRTYKRKAVELANSLKPEVVVDVGCGLGEIIGKVHAKVKYGMDIDKNALIIARLLHRDTKFVVGSFEKVIRLPIYKIDLIIMLNFLHGLEVSNWISSLREIIEKKAVRYILIDNYTPEYISKLAPEEKDKVYIHNLEEYFNNLKTVKVIDDGGEQARFLILYEVMNNG